MIICVTSRVQNPADFTVKLENTVHFTRKYEMSVKSISHGPSAMFNVTKESNMFFVVDTRKAYVKREVYTIPPGYYKSVDDLLGEMNIAIRDKAKQDRDAGRVAWAEPRFTLDRLTNTCQLAYSEDSHLAFQPHPEKNDLLRFFTMFDHVTKPQNQIIAKLDDFPTHDDLGFIYSTIAPEAPICVTDEENDRFLALFPFRQSSGYNHYEFLNPLYHIISFSSVHEIRFQLMNNMKQPLNFRNNVRSDFPTVIVLHFREVL